ncbi:MAG: hypothetical protein H3C27_01140 [Opitutaceae bacterium]|nr:hypothetical protein [Opitutaceae bacterium]
MSTQPDQQQPTGIRLLSIKQVAGLLGYTNRISGWRAVKKLGIPYVRINRRRIVFEEDEVQAWIKRRSVGNRTAA